MLDEPPFLDKLLECVQNVVARSRAMARQPRLANAIHGVRRVGILVDVREQLSRQLGHGHGVSHFTPLAARP